MNHERWLERTEPCKPKESKNSAQHIVDEVKRLGHIPEAWTKNIEVDGDNIECLILGQVHFGGKIVERNEKGFVVEFGSYLYHYDIATPKNLYCGARTNIRRWKS